MDIFTTQLTRVVSLPIKPANLKVKPPKKESANTKLSQDPDHLENHNTYFHDEEYFLSTVTQRGEMQQLELLDSSDSTVNSEKKIKQDDADTQPTVDRTIRKHLDLYA